MGDGWGSSDLASWRLDHDSFVAVRKAVVNPPASRWESGKRRPWMPKRERKKKQAVEDARQRKFPF